MPLDATAGYAKIAMTSNEEMSDVILSEDSINGLSYVLGQHYTNGRFTKTEIDNVRTVGVLTKEFGEFSQFHQGAGEDAILDLFRLLQEIPEQSLLVIDEVENSLHPQAQRRLIRYLIKCVRVKKIQIIMSTHSPFILEELPSVARVMLHRLADKKDIVYGTSAQYALNYIDNDVEHPLLYVHVEDEEAVKLFWSIIKKDKTLYDRCSKIVSVRPVGSFKVVKTLNDYALAGNLPYESLSIVDGDAREECPTCLSFPGDEAPEKVVFKQLREKRWKNLDTRFGVGAGNLFKYLDDAMLLIDHHEWTASVGDKIKNSKDDVWSVMVDEWVKQCLPDDVVKNFLSCIKGKIDDVMK